jgi:hypothetical protein
MKHESGHLRDKVDFLNEDVPVLGTKIADSRKCPFL